MSFDGQRKIPHLEIPLKLLRDTDFMVWLRSAEGNAYLHLYSWIVRSDKVKSNVGKLIFNNYYKKGILAARWDLKTIAENLGYSGKSTGYMSRLLTNMEKKGIIKKHSDKLSRRAIKIYEFGIHCRDPYEHETLHAFVYFTKLSAKNKLADFLGGNPPIS